MKETTFKIPYKSELNAFERWKKNAIQKMLPANGHCPISVCVCVCVYLFAYDLIKSIQHSSFRGNRLFIFIYSFNFCWWKQSAHKQARTHITPRSIFRNCFVSRCEFIDFVRFGLCYTRIHRIHLANQRKYNMEINTIWETIACFLQSKAKGAQ